MANGTSTYDSIAQHHFIEANYNHNSIATMHPRHHPRIRRKRNINTVTNINHTIIDHNNTNEDDYKTAAKPIDDLSATSEAQQQQQQTRCRREQSNTTTISSLIGRRRRRCSLLLSPLVLILLTFYLITICLNNNNNLLDAYNLDTQKALLKHGPKGSYFGYSIAQHSTFDLAQPNSTFRSYVIVGAPKAESIRSAALAGVVRPGAIYKCDFSLSSTCQLIDIDSLVHSTSLSTTSSNVGAAPSGLAAALQAGDASSSSSSSSSSNAEGTSGNLKEPTGELLPANMDPIPQRDNQWLGVSVKSQGPNGYAVACAHRYVLKGLNYQWGQGICYSLTRNLTLHKHWSPCLNRPVNKAQEEYGYCQAGTSSDVSESADIVVGTPGPYNWRGTVFTNSIAFTAKDDRTWYMAPVQDEEAKVDRYSYLGMSLVTGKFFNKQQYYVSGAPRSNGTGQVLLMAKQYLNGRRGESTLRTDQILSGEQIASSFGYSMAKLDFNGDGLPDLAVAAPFYYTKDEGGAVYLFANKEGKTMQPAGRLTGKPESRFGFALANCGDLNHDKYDDLAIGAPYDPQGGTVYIHLGSAAGIKPTASQVIKASAISSNLQTFGYSLSGGLDMDKNGYPDLVVGSYADDSVYILRARPIIQISTKIEGNLTRIDPNKTTCDGEKNQLPCFKFNTCFELDPAAIGEYSSSMKLKYRIEAETFTGMKYSRVKFQESENTDTPQIVEKEIMIEDYYRGMKLKRCNAQRVYIKDRSDIQTPIQFKLTYSLVPPNTPASSTSSGSGGLLSTSGSSRYSLQSNSLISSSLSSSSGSSALNSLSSSSSSGLTGASSQTEAPFAAGIEPTFPILNQEEAQRIFSAKFLKDCGSNDICESHLDVDGQLTLPKETLGINEPGYPTDKQINVTIRASNMAEPAYEAKLFVTHPASLAYGGFKTSKQVVAIECSSVEKNLIKCDLGNPMPKGTTKLLMIFNTQNQAGTFDFNLMVNTTSQNAKEAKTSYDLSGTIRKKVEIQIPQRLPPSYPEAPVQEPPAWLILLSILLGILLFSALFYCLYVNGFFERSKAQYQAADTEDRFH